MQTTRRTRRTRYNDIILIEGSTQEGVEGTGLGEGKGKKDISEELEYEEQIEGLKGEAEGSDNEQNPVLTLIYLGR